MCSANGGLTPHGSAEEKHFPAPLLWSILSPLMACYNVRTREGALTNEFHLQERRPLPDMRDGTPVKG